MRRKIQLVQEARHFVQVQAGDVFRPAVLDDLADEPFPLEWIGQIKSIGAPDDMFWRREAGLVCASV